MTPKLADVPLQTFYDHATVVWALFSDVGLDLSTKTMSRSCTELHWIRASNDVWRLDWRHLTTHQFTHRPTSQFTGSSWIPDGHHSYSDPIS